MMAMLKNVWPKMTGVVFTAPVTGLLILVSLLIFGLAGPAAPPLLLYADTTPNIGWLSGHLAHSDIKHLGWNLGALAILGLTFERLLGRHLLWALGLSVIAINLWFVFAQQGLTSYCGLSGVLNAVLASGLVHWWRSARDPLVLLIGLGAVIKIAVELFIGDSLLPTTDWQPVPLAHAIGFAAGVTIGLIKDVNRGAAGNYVRMAAH